MNFFRKVGRPTDDELRMIQSIERIITDKGIPLEEIPECLSLDDLIEVKTLLESYTPPINEVENEPILEVEEEQFNNNDEQEIDEVESEVQDSENVEEEQDNLNQFETSFEEVKNNQKPQFIAEDYDPFADPIIERSYNQNQGLNQEDEDPDEEQLDLENTNVKDLNPATKRKAAEQTANALLKGYARLVPEPFKWMAKLPEAKIEKMAFNGDLDLSLEVSEGLTFDDYMKQTNEQIDEIFKVEQDTLDEIKEPLIEVLMEQQLELTPTQRLTMAVISHLAQMFTVALKLRQQNNRILSYQKHLTYLSRVKSA